MNVSIPSKVFNMTLVSNVKKQLERVDSTSQIIGTRDDSRDTETIVEDCCFKKLIDKYGKTHDLIDRALHDLPRASDRAYRGNRL